MPHVHVPTPTKRTTVPVRVQTLGGPTVTTTGSRTRHRWHPPPVYAPLREPDDDGVEVRLIV